MLKIFQQRSRTSSSIQIVFSVDARAQATPEQDRTMAAAILAQPQRGLFYFTLVRFLPLCYLRYLVRNHCIIENPCPLRVIRSSTVVNYYD
jgi:hypothetical protein